MTGHRVRTVLGDIEATTLGRTNYHEHLFQVSPLLVGDELDDEALSGREAMLLRQAGTEAMVDATPVGLGRNPAAIARISAAEGLRVVATSGAHREPHYAGRHWLLEATETQLAKYFIDDINCGMAITDTERPEVRGPVALGPDGNPVRAGMLKAGIGYWSISGFERRVLAAVGAAHVATGAPVMVHLEHGSAGLEVLAVLQAEGVDSTAVALAHIDRNLDPHVHAELAAAGAYLGYDGFARSRTSSDASIIDCLAASIDLGAGPRVLLGGDVARRSRYLAYGGMPGLSYLEGRIIPRLTQRIGRELLQAALVANPARWLGRFSAAAAADKPNSRRETISEEPTI